MEQSIAEISTKYDTISSPKRFSQKHWNEIAEQIENETDD